MKKIIYILILITLSILSSGCKQKLELEDKVFPLVLEKEKEIRIDIIAKESPSFTKIDDKNYIYLYVSQNQDKNCEIFKMTPGLEIKERFVIKRGIGPGEAMNPRIYGGDNRSIIVYDPPMYKYLEFDPNFKFLNQYRLNDLGTFLYSGARYIPTYKLVLDGYEKLINRYDTLIRIYTRALTDDKKTEDSKLFETRFTEYKKNHKMIFAKPIHFGYFFNHIYILDKREYRLVKMTLEGKTVEEKTISFDSKSFSDSERKKWVKKYFGEKDAIDFDYPEELWPANWLMQIGNGIAVGRLETYDPDFNGPVKADYFDPDLNYMGRITLPPFEYSNQPNAGQMVDLSFMFKDGVFYSSEERGEEFWIVRWRVKNEKQE